MMNRLLVFILKSSFVWLICIQSNAQNDWSKKVNFIQTRLKMDLNPTSFSWHHESN